MTSSNVTIPKWLMSIIGAGAGILATGLMAWMTSLQSDMGGIKVQLAMLTTRIEATAQERDSWESREVRTAEQLEARLQRIETKLDRALGLAVTNNQTVMVIPDTATMIRQRIEDRRTQLARDNQ